MRILFAVFSTLIVFSGIAQTTTQTSPQEVKRIRVAVPAFVNTCDPRFPNAQKEAIRDGIDRIARDYFQKAFFEIDYTLIGQEETKSAADALKIDFSKGKNRTVENLSKLGTQLNAGFVILALFEQCSQENSGNADILGNLGGAQSQSVVRARVWLADVPNRKLLVDGSKFFIEGEAKGPFFGTTKKGEVKGNPQDVQFVIMEENKRRTNWLGKAAAQALYLAVGGLLGFKSPP